MSAIPLPDPIAAYFVADAGSPDDVARCFTTQGIVKDHRRTHVGRDAIRAWNAHASTQYTWTNDPFSLERVDGIHRVRSHVAGSFPGSPIDMTLEFRLERGLIASLEITA